VAEGCISKLDLQALANFWSIREVRLPKISKSEEADALPHKQPNGVKTADALLQVFAMQLDCNMCCISDIEVYINPDLMAGQLREIIDDLHPRHLRSADVACVQREQNVWDLSKSPLRPEIEGEMSYAFAAFVPKGSRAQKLQQLLDVCMTSARQLRINRS
jgi:hypothetical protein